MSFDLPAPLPQYFAAGDRNASAPLFAPDASCSMKGRCIAEAKKSPPGSEASSGYQPRYELIDASRDGARTLVTFKVSGTFAGSPVTLQQALVTDGDKIVSLETL